MSWAQGLASRPLASGPRLQHVAPGQRGLGGSSGVALAGPHRRSNVLCTKAFSGRPQEQAVQPAEACSRVS